MLFFKKARLERQLINEIKCFAGVEEFPDSDARAITNLLMAYNRGNEMIALSMFSSQWNVLEKYPDLYDNWDNVMLKYKKLGLFPKWNVIL